MLYYRDSISILLINAFKNKVIVLLRLLLVSAYPLSKLGTSPTLTSVMSQQGASLLINISSPLMAIFPLLNRTEFMFPVTSLAFYLYCFIIYYLNFSLVVVLVIILVQLQLCTHSVLACYTPLVAEKHLNKGVELLLLF
jgi:hypothetical protein